MIRRNLLTPCLTGLFALTMISACTPKDASSAANAAAPIARHPVSGLAVISLSISSSASSGQFHRFRAELAKTDAEQEKGLMYRTSMGPDEGMLFPYPDHRQVAFWMKNTVIPLDIIFIGADKRILNIADAKPYDETPLPSAGAVSGVLELNAGRAAQLGIKPGDKVEW